MIAKAHAGTAKERTRIPGGAGRVLAQSADYENTLNAVASLAVLKIADWCAIDLVGEDGTLVRAVTQHRDPGQRSLTTALHQTLPRPDAHEHITILATRGVHSTICTPLVAGSRIVGAITLGTAIGRTLSSTDVQTAKDLAALAAFALDNAWRYEQSQRALRDRDELLAIVTHDLRTPLSAVIASASLLTSKDCARPDVDDIRHRGATIQRAARHMVRLIDDLSALGQVNAGHFTVDAIPEDPGGVIREVLDALEPLVTARGGSLSARAGPDLPHVSFDRDRLRQVLTNLVENASQVGATAIVVGAEVRGAELVVWVEDNGPGVPAADLPRMFDPYFRGSASGYRGSGLGLPIARAIVSAHGGRMWLESTVGAGTTFFLALPC